jgi:hypothetical protein
VAHFSVKKPAQFWVKINSYWDSRFSGDIFGVFEATLAVTLTALLCARLRQWWERALVLVVAGPMVIPILLTGSLHSLHGMG